MNDINQQSPQHNPNNDDYVRNASGPFIPQALREFKDRDELCFRFLQANAEEHVYTFKQVYEEILKRGRRLHDIGLKKGDRLAIVLPQPEDFVFTFLAAMIMGIVPVPLYPPLGFGQLDAYLATSARILTLSKAHAIVTDAKIQHILWSIADKIPTLKHLVVVDKLRSEPKNQSDIADIQADDIAFLQYTSGSTSLPKGVIVTHGSLLANIDAIANYGLQTDRKKDHAVSWLPLYHDMGLIGFLLTPIWFGNSITYLSPIAFVKRPRIWLEAMHKYHGTIAFAPNFAYALAAKRTKPEDVAKLDLSHVKVLGCGAEPNHPGTLNAFLKHFEPAGLKPNVLLPCYGMAEATLAISFTKLEDTIQVDRIDPEAYQTEHTVQNTDSEDALEFVNCGRPFPGHTIKIVDENNQVLPEMHVGQIVLEGPSITAGYFEAPEQTRDTYTDIGLKTGDLGYIHNGDLYVTGRIKDLIIINGRNYDPQSIEWAVQEIEGLRKGNVVVFGVEGEHTESLVIVGEVNADVDHDTIQAKVVDAVRKEFQLQIDDIVLIPKGQLPKTSSGKVQRQKTKIEYLEGTLGSTSVRQANEHISKRHLAKIVATSAIKRAKFKFKKTVSAIVKPGH